MGTGALDPTPPSRTPAPADADHRLADAVGAIYATVMAPELWPEALEKVAAVFGDHGANLFFIRDDGSFGIVVSPSMRAAQVDYDRTWWKQDIRTVRAIEYGYAAGVEAITDRHVVTDTEIAEHPYFTSFLRPHGLGWFAGVAINPDPGIVLALSVHRSMTDKPPFSDDELRIMTRLGRFAENALRLSSRLLTAEITNLAFGDVLARLKVGVYLLDENGKLLLANPSGQQMLGKALMLTDGRLTTRFEPEAGALQSAVDLVIGSTPRVPAGVAPPVVIHGEDDSDYAVAYVLPVHATPDHPFAKALIDARAIIVVRESAAHDPVDPALVRDLLDVTLGEARVAALVGAGLQPKEAAAQLGIAEETARSVLKRVFAKTGVSRQSDLAALLSRLVLR